MTNHKLHFIESDIRTLSGRKRKFRGKEQLTFSHYVIINSPYDSRNYFNYPGTIAKSFARDFSGRCLRGKFKSISGEENTGMYVLNIYYHREISFRDVSSFRFPFRAGESKRAWTARPLREKDVLLNLFISFFFYQAGASQSPKLWPIKRYNGNKNKTATLRVLARGARRGGRIVQSSSRLTSSRDAHWIPHGETATHKSHGDAYLATMRIGTRRRRI